MNPYDSPKTDFSSNKINTLSNPAKPLLYIIGGFCLFQSVFVVPIGMFVGPQILAAGIAMLVFGTTAILLGRRRFDGFGRSATIAWGVSAILLILIAIGLEPPSTQDIGVLFFTGLVLLLIGAVPVIAIQNRPTNSIV